jgi:hypothetical protein
MKDVATPSTIEVRLLGSKPNTSGPRGDRDREPRGPAQHRRTSEKVAKNGPRVRAKLGPISAVYSCLAGFPQECMGQLAQLGLT